MEHEARLEPLERALKHLVAYPIEHWPESAHVKHRLLAPFHFYEFFSGGGMARLGLGDRWVCDFANDIDIVKYCV